jgi:hypothetical protein
MSLGYMQVPHHFIGPTLNICGIWCPGGPGPVPTDTEG